MERRLAAILAADVAGYSLLMNADESATYSAWRAARQEVVDPCIGALKGRIVKHTGDGFLAEFPTVLAAVECAVSIQEQMAKRDAEVVDGHTLQFRIGVNLGDIIVDEEDIHGDGVNIAARLESIAEAGGVCISAGVYNQVSNKSGFGFQDLGARSLKNIAAPVRVYGVFRAGAKPGVRASPLAADVDERPHAPAAPIQAVLDNAATVTHRSAGVVVGRESEKQILFSAFAEARRGVGNIVLIRGEPGIGKSSLAHSIAQSAVESGARVVYGQCHETLGSPPFWPWLQILKSLQQSTQGEQMSSANIFERLAKAEAPSSPSAHSTFSSNAGAEQFLLFSQIEAVLAQHAGEKTLVIVIDDLHWADRSSLLLLTHLCRKLADRAIFIVGTYRDIEITRKHPLFESLGEINRQATLRRIALKGLSRDEVSGYIERTIKHRLPAAVLKTLYDKTEGNPLFVSEVAKILQQENLIRTGEQLIVEIPDGIQETIGRRLNQLSDKCSELLGMASVIGRNFTFRVLCALVPDSDEMSLLDSLEEAVARGIIDDSGDGATGFQFCHVLMRDILYAELSLAKKIILHKKVADALVQLRQSGAEHVLGEIARHYYQALQAGQAANAIRYAMEAAEHALKLSAYDEARGYYEIALDVTSVDEGEHAARLPELYFRLSQCMQLSGRPDRETVPMLDRCLREAREHGQHRLFAEAACLKVYNCRNYPFAVEASKSIDEALSVISGEDFATRAKVLAHRAVSLIFNHRRREAERVVYEAVSVAAESGDAIAHCNALCLAIMVLRGRPEKLTERIRLGELALTLARDMWASDKDVFGDDVVIFDPLEWLILSYQEIGDLARVRALIAELDAAVDRNYVFKSRYFAAGASACLALFEGRWADAEALVEKADDIGADKLDGGAEGVYGAQMFFLNRELGRLPMVHGAIRQMVKSDSAMWTPGLLATYTDLGLATEARELFFKLTADDFELVVDDELYPTTLVYLSEACMEFDLGDKAKILYQRLVPYSGQMVAHPTAVCYGPADLYLGMLCSQMNDFAEAERLFENALALCERCAPNIWQAHIAYRHAQVLRRHNYKSEKAVFADRIADARASAQSLGMVNLLHKIDKLASDAPTGEQPRACGLSRRELQVLELIVQGKSNKVIAGELNRSLATVATHVRAILQKTHTSNRTEAAAFARENQLLEDRVRP